LGQVDDIQGTSSTTLTAIKGNRVVHVDGKS